eukprot:517059-Rhodomonas_salina.1
MAAHSARILAGSACMHARAAFKDGSIKSANTNTTSINWKNCQLDGMADLQQSFADSKRDLVPTPTTSVPDVDAVPVADIALQRRRTYRRACSQYWSLFRKPASRMRHVAVPGIAHSKSEHACSSHALAHSVQPSGTAHTLPYASSVPGHRTAHSTTGRAHTPTTPFVHTPTTPF